MPVEFPDPLGQPLVSVIMNCYNGEQFLQEAIDSVVDQTYENWELILWDNASTDDTQSIAKNNARESRLKYHRATTNTPLGAARNLAIGCAKGEYIAFLDCDDRWLPKKLSEQVTLLQNRPTVDFLFGNFFFTRPGSNRLKVGFKRRQSDGYIFGDLLKYFSVNLQTVVIRKSTLNTLAEWFDESLSLAEDYDLFLRFLYGREAVYLHAPLVVYRMHAGMSSIRSAEKYPDEMVYCIEKLRRLYPEIDLEYPEEMEYLAGKVSFWRARAEMSQGNSEKARSLLRAHRFRSLLFFLLYGVSYLPPRLWLKVQDLRLYFR